MNVKVSYTVNMEEVPTLVNELLSDCRQKLTADSGKLKFSLHNISQMFKDLNDVRETLVLVEQKVQDAINIASGWIEAQQEPDELQEYEETEERDEEDQDG